MRTLAARTLAITVAIAGCTAGSNPRPTTTDSDAAERASFVSTEQEKGGSRADLSFTSTSDGFEARETAFAMWTRVEAERTVVADDRGEWTFELRTGGLTCATGAHVAATSTTAPALESPQRAVTTKKLGDASTTERTTNGPLGVEQTWSVDSNPCAGSDFEFRVQIAGLAPRASYAGIDLVDGNGRVRVKYTDIFVRDVKGDLRTVRATAESDAIVLHVPASSLAFPIEIDPLIWVPLQPAVITDGAYGDGLGNIVAISGGVALIGLPTRKVGANAGQGVVYVFAKTGDTWSLQKELSAADGAANDGFGARVGISGTTLIAAAPGKTVGANHNQGAVYVFTQSGTTWTQQAMLSPSDAVASEAIGNFESAIAISGDDVLVGDPSHRVGSVAAPRICNFRRTGTTWAQSADITPSGVSGLNAVAVDADTFVLGSTDAAYVFVRSGATWTLQQKLVSSDFVAGDAFGVNAVALSGDSVIVGASGRSFDDSLGANHFQAGTAYIFGRSGTTWTQQAELTLDTAAMDEDAFGLAVAISGDSAVVSAPPKLATTTGKTGAAYFFVRTGSTWVQQRKFIGADDGSDDYFGEALGISGNDAIIGAEGTGTGPTLDQGAAYFYRNALAQGTTCAAAADCGSGFCVDGTCCDTACTGVCEACTAALKTSGKDDGTCGPVSTGTNPHHDDCPIGAAGTCSGDGTCDGAGACRTHAAGGATCGSSCANDQETDSTCSASGTCTPQATPRSCGNYACGTDSCKTACAAGTDCADGFACTDGKCVASLASCVDATTSRAVDGTITDCKEYKCDTSGTCKTSCSSVDGCASPNVCDMGGHCVAPPNDSSSGCNVVAPDSPRCSRWTLLGLAFGLTLLARRRLRPTVT